jgi:hypothetical protein
MLFEVVGYSKAGQSAVGTVFPEGEVNRFCPTLVSSAPLSHDEAIQQTVVRERAMEGNEGSRGCCWIIGNSFQGAMAVEEASGGVGCLVTGKTREKEMVTR